MPGERSVFDASLRAATARLGIDITAPQLNRMWSHYLAMCDANTRFNLTRITDAADAAVKHYADSLALSAWSQKQGLRVRTFLDVGTGPGFPAVPLAIVESDWLVTAIDSTAKKAAFVADWASASKTTNLIVIHARAEHWTAPERFDLVAFRATGTIAKCLTQAQGVVAAGGRVVCYKTRNLAADEVAEAARVAKALGFRAQPSFDYDLPGGDGVLERQLVVHRHG